MTSVKNIYGSATGCKHNTNMSFQYVLAIANRCVYDDNKKVSNHANMYVSPAICSVNKKTTLI